MFGQLVLFEWTETISMTVKLFHTLSALQATWSCTFILVKRDERLQKTITHSSHIPWHGAPWRQTELKFAWQYAYTGLSYFFFHNQCWPQTWIPAEDRDLALKQFSGKHRCTHGQCHDEPDLFYTPWRCTRKYSSFCLYGGPIRIMIGDASCQISDR